MGLLFVLVLFSCNRKDKDKLMISGTVSDPKLNVMVSGMTINLLAQKVESGTWNGNYNFLQTTTTTGDGSFSFSLDPDYFAGFRLTFTREDYFYMETDINSNLVSKGEEYHSTYSVFPESYLRLHVKNMYPVDSADLVSFKLDQSMPACSTCCTGDVLILKGNAVDTTILCRLYGESSFVITGHAAKGDNITILSYPVFCPSFDTTSQNLFY